MLSSSPGKMSECENSFRGKVLCLFLLDSPVKNSGRPGVVAHAFNPRTPEAETGGFLSSSQPGLQSEFQDSQSYTEKLSQKTKERAQENT